MHVYATSVLDLSPHLRSDRTHLREPGGLPKELLAYRTDFLRGQMMTRLQELTFVS